MKKFLHISPVIIILNLSVLLLVYFGYGEAKRTFWKFKLDKLKTQSEITRDLMDDFLKMGLPLSLIKDFLEKETALGTFAGFSVFLDPDTSASKSGITIAVLNMDDEIVFSSKTTQNSALGQKAARLKTKTANADRFDYRHTLIRNTRYAVCESDAHYQMTLPLHDKFTQVGNLVVSLSKAPVQHYLQSQFRGVFYFTLFICLFLSALVVILDRPWAARHHKSLLGAGYSLASLTSASLIVVTLISIYSHGAEDKMRMLAKSLANRLNAIVDSGVEFETVYGLDAMLLDYQQLDKDIHTVALSINRVVMIHPDSGAVGRPWQVPTNQKEYIYNIGNSRATVIVTMDEAIIHYKVLLAVKNLATLIAASFFIGFLTFNVGTTLRNFPAKKAANDYILNKENHFSQSLYETMMPVWFLVVFAESLNLSFLPKYLNDICAVGQIPQSYCSVLFSAFFVGFALILVPSGYLSDRWSDKYMILLGIISFVVTMVLMGVTQHYFLVLTIRFLSGAAQGIVFIGVQNYIRKISLQGRMTQGGAVIVFSFNGGIISGSAIGSILLADIGIQGIFFSAAAISMAAFIFTLLYIPGLPKPRSNAFKPYKTDLLKTISKKARTLMRDGEFMRTLFLVGATSKVTFTGVTIYAVPLLMIQLNFTQEDIGLAIMLYAAAVLISNYYISRWVDKTGNIPFALFGGVLVSSIGIMAIGLVDWVRISASLSYSVTLLFFGGMLLLGMANGAISAPVVSHIMGTRACRTLGEGAGVGAYRLFERMGHVAGPLIIGQLFTWSNQRMKAILLLGIVIAVFGFAFLVSTDRRRI
jgi:predicted MFS family arabinose efflux permease